MAAERRLSETSAAVLFDAGNVTEVAMFGPPDVWQTWAAWGVLGRADKAVPGLSRFDGPQARFYEAVSHWIVGDEAKAAALLSPLDDPHAANLLRLIEQDRVRVLAQFPPRVKTPHVLREGLAAHPRFDVRVIGPLEGDLPLVPYANVGRYLGDGFTPDFFIAEMLEWHLLPPDLKSLPCPTFGHTSDYDLHIQTIRPWLGVFDEILTLDQYEWRGVRDICDVPVFTAPKVFGLREEDLPETSGLPAADAPRGIDAFVSGTIAHPYHLDKDILFGTLLNAPDINPLLCEGFLPRPLYWDLMARSKCTICFVRHPSAMPTRAMESLAAGVPTLVHEDSAIRLYVDDDKGLIPYANDGRDLLDRVRHARTNERTFLEQALGNAPAIRDAFSVARVTGEYLRFLTYRAAAPRERTPGPPPRTLRQQRSVFWKGWSPASATAQALFQRNIEQWMARARLEPDPALLNDVFRELILAHCDAMMRVSAPDDHMHEELRQVLDFMGGLVRSLPRALIPRFNFIRACIHFGEERDIDDALRMAETVLALPDSSHDLPPEIDVFPWDVFDGHFNYRRYLDAIATLARDGETARDAMRRGVMASLNAYVGLLTGAVERLERAVALDPGFPPYRLWLVERLTALGRHATAREFADGLPDSCLIGEAVAAAIDRPEVTDRFATRLIRIGGLHNPYSAYFKAQIIPRPAVWRTRTVVHAVTSPRLAVVAAMPSQALADALTAAKGDRSDVEIVWCGPSNAARHGRRCADTIVEHVEPHGHPSRHRGFNNALLDAAAPFALLIDDAQSLPPGFFDAVVAALADDPRRVLLPRDSGLRDGAFGDAEAVLRAPIGQRTASWLAAPRETLIAAHGFDEEPAYGPADSGVYNILPRLARLKDVTFGVLPPAEEEPRPPLPLSAPRFSTPARAEIVRYMFNAHHTTPRLVNPGILQALASMCREG